MMKSILFPTDFSTASLKAFEYALRYAEHIEARLVVYHSYSSAGEVSEDVQALYKKVDIENFRSKKDKFPPFEEIIERYRTDKSIKVKYVVKEGDFIDTFKAYIERKEDQIELLIMGTQATKRGMFDVFMETKTAVLLQEIHKPIIAIPERVEFDGTIDNIAFLTDYRSEDVLALKDVMEICQRFDARLHVLHFDLAHGESIVPLMERFKRHFKGDPVAEQAVFEAIDTINLKASLAEYCTQHKIDMVCLVNQRRNFYQRLFSYSLTQDLLHNIDVAVMAIYNE